MQVWQDDWFDAALASATDLLWRGVEAQHVVATMRLVDTLDEQNVLEQILEASKPPLPPALQAPAAPSAGHGVLHYLLQTPFRYRSPYPSRFRRGGEAGLFYGARERETACAEVAYWRWRFLMDSEGLRDGELVTEHTLFLARVRGTAIDLTRRPWSAAAARWTHTDDYTACQSLTPAARERGIAWIRYASVRHPGGRCGAVLDPLSLSLPARPEQQTWVCKVTARQALMVHDDDRYAMTFAA